MATALALQGTKVSVLAATTGQKKLEVITETFTSTTYAVWVSEPTETEVFDWQMAHATPPPAEPSDYSSPDPSGKWQGPTVSKGWVDQDATVISTYVLPTPPEFSKSAPYQRADGKWVVRFRFTTALHYNWQ